MKRTVLFLLLPACLLVGNLSFAQPAVSVKGGKVAVGGTPVDAAWRLKPLLEKVGPDYRLFEGYNRVYTYDRYGLVFFEKKSDDAGTDELLEIQLFFAPGETNNVSPKGTYSGQAHIEKVQLNANLASQTLLRKLKKYEQTDSYSEHNYRLSYKGVYIYLLFNDTEQNLKKISIGPDRR